MALGMLQLLIGASACDAVNGASVPEADNVIACALDGASGFDSECEIYRTVVEGQLEIVVIHPNGAFRRLLVQPDGSGMITGDGASEASNAIAGNQLEVTVDDDRYRFPADIGGGNAS